MKNKSYKQYLCFGLLIFSIGIFLLMGCIPTEVVESADAALAQTAQMTAIIGTPSTEEISKSNELTNAIVLVGVVLVLIVVGGTLLGIRNIY